MFFFANGFVHADGDAHFVGFGCVLRATWEGVRFEREQHRHLRSFLLLLAPVAAVPETTRTEECRRSVAAMLAVEGLAEIAVEPQPDCLPRAAPGQEEPLLGRWVAQQPVAEVLAERQQEEVLAPRAQEAPRKPTRSTMG